MKTDSVKSETAESDNEETPELILSVDEPPRMIWRILIFFAIPVILTVSCLVVFGIIGGMIYLSYELFELEKPFTNFFSGVFK